MHKTRQDAYAMSLYNHILLEIVQPILGSESTFSNDLTETSHNFLHEKYQGTFSSDTIPKLTTKRPYCIVNTDTSHEPGSHWMALAKTKNGILVYDSFGRRTKKILPSALKGNGLARDAEHDAEQKTSEGNCGARSLSWLLLFDEFGAEMASLI